MVQPDAEAMPVRNGIVAAIGIVNKIGTVEIGGFFVFREDITVGAAEKIIACKVHAVVEESPCSIGARHIRCVDTILTASSTPVTTAAAHTSHHTARKVVKAAVICIVGIEEDAELAFICKITQEACSLNTPVIH